MITISTVTYVFLIAALGYLLGAVRFKNISLGTSGVLLTALVFGHFGIELPSFVRNFGLAIFVGSVGLMAGPVFVRNLRAKVYAYMLLAVGIVFCGAAVTLLLGKLLQVPFDLSIGMFTGAMTSTPGLAAAIDATEMILGPGNSMASIGYGITYPFGVVGIVLFVQMFPRIVHADMQAEARALSQRLHQPEPETAQDKKERRTLNIGGLFAFSAVLAAGVLLGDMRVPLPGGLSFSLGMAGGPLFVGLAAGHFGRMGKISLSVPETTLKTMRELGLCLFLIGSGVNAGAGFVSVLQEYGAVLFGMGIVITLLPMILACLFARRALRMDTLSALGGVCGGMTSTPALGALITASGTEDVAAAYAAAYPFSLIGKIFFCQILALIW